MDARAGSGPPCRGTRRGFLAWSLLHLLGGCGSGAGAGGAAFPALDLARLDGGRLRVADYRGRPVLINIWASWCGPCRAEMADLDELAQAAPGGLGVAGVSVDRDVRLAQEYLRRVALRFPNAWEGDARVVSLGLSVTSIPSTFLVDASGRLAWRVSGARHWASPAMRSEIGARLAAAPVVTALR